MAAYEGKATIVESAMVTEDNVAEIAKAFGFEVRDGQLYDSKGAIINAGIHIVKFEDGSINYFTDKVFNKLFRKVEPPEYKLSDIADFDRDIKRKGWAGLYLRNTGYCFVQCDSDGPVIPYTFTAEDLAATDWQYVE